MLFDAINSTPIDLRLPDSDIIYYPNFIAPTVAKKLFDALLNQTPWQQDPITVFGKTYLQPRKTALYGKTSSPYSYSGITMHPKPYTKALAFLDQMVSEKLQKQFTSCLLNLYVDGTHSNGWHSDNEKELGPAPCIASVSFGATRVFSLQHKTQKSVKKKIALPSGSLLVMQGQTQDFWKHAILKTKKPTAPRINVTFRTIL